MASFNKTSKNNNNKNSSSRFAILETLDNDSEDSPMTATPQDNTFEVTIEVEQAPAPTRSFSDENEFVDLERGITNFVEEFAKTPEFFDDFDHHTPLIFDNLDHVKPLVFDDEDCVFVDGEDTPSSPRPEMLGGGGGHEEEQNEEEADVAVAPLHVRLNIPGFREDDRSGTLGTISLTLAKLKKSGIHPFPGRTYITLPSTNDLIEAGYNHKVSETFRSDLALMNSKSIGTMCKWIYDENSKAMENLTVKLNIQTADNAVEFIFQKKTDKPQATVHGGSTQALKSAACRS